MRLTTGVAMATEESGGLEVASWEDGSDAAARGRWRRFDERLELVALRPTLAEGVLLRTIGDAVELFQPSTRRVVPLELAQVPLVRRFDGRCSIGEIIVAGVGDRGFALQPVLTLLDRLVRAGLLQGDVPQAQWRSLIDHVARLTLVGGAAAVPNATEDGARPDPAVAEAAEPRRPLTAAMEERAAFLRGVKLLEPLDDDAIARLAEVAHEETWPAASDILSEGARADRFFIVRTGEVNVARKGDGSAERLRLGTLGAGEWFGEAGLLEGAPRNATVRASLSRPVQLISFDAGLFEQLIQPHLPSQPAMDVIERRRAKLGSVPLFRALPAQELDRLAAALEQVTVAKGTVLFRQGEPADRFFVLVEGSVGVVRDGRPIARLMPGEFFGETALLFTEERTATIAATEDSVLWALDQASFTSLVRDVLLHRHDMMPTVLGRITSTDPV